MLLAAPHQVAAIFGEFLLYICQQIENIGHNHNFARSDHPSTTLEANSITNFDAAQ